MRVSTTKPVRENNKTTWDVTQERDRRYARLINRGGSSLELFWDLNEEAIRDQIVKIKVGDKSAYVNAEELKRFLRWC